MKTMGLLLVFLGLAAFGAWLLLGKSSGTARAMAPAATSADKAITPAQLDAFLAPYRDALQATTRPVLRITLAEFPEDLPTASKLGGRAWWPAGEPAPAGADGRPLVLLAQLDFAEMPARPGYPSKGLLQFFIASDDLYGANFDGGDVVSERTAQRNFRIAYWPDTQVPSQVLPALEPDQDMLPHDPRRPMRLRFTPGDETLSSGDYRFNALLGGNAYDTARAYAQAHQLSADGLLNAVYERLSGFGHKVGGYPGFTQEDPREGGDWELLLQIDTDDGAGVMWGDAGIGNFFIAPADLARADFSRVMYTWDCY
ncbi:MAG: YwqG family protein [Arenimonas sp.]|nr:YwqG family protein [Arenimonas sp.]